MLNLYKYSLGPLFLAQARRVRRTALRLPEAAGPRSGAIAARGGKPPIRLLFVGDSVAAGVGVAHQENALAAPCATSLAAHAGRSIEWSLIAKSGVNTVEAMALLAQHEIRPADVVIVALGTNDVTSQRTPKQFLGDYKALVSELVERTGAGFVIVNGLPPLHILPAAPHPLRWYLGKYAKRLDAELRAWIATRAGFGYVSLQWAAVPQDMAADRYHPGPAQYRRWAHMVAEKIAELMQPSLLMTPKLFVAADALENLLNLP